MLRNIILLVSIMLNVNVLSQVLIQGKIVDSETKAPLGYVHILIHEESDGQLSNNEGRFSFRVNKLPVTLIFSAVGYQPDSILLKDTRDSYSLEIVLNAETILLEEVNILADQARERYNPISFSSINRDKIIQELGDKPLPEVLNFTPGLFAVREGGGSGDATVRIRGFEQENIAVLLNGVPINGAENGLVYWNNWMGLTEIAESIQVQRGIGASKVALNSVGGTINITAMGNDAERKVTASMQTTDYGNRKISIGFHSGLTKKGWNFGFLASRTKGDGYIPGTYVDGWAYFANVSKEISKKQRLVLNLLGGPERHGQRNQKLSIAEADQYGFDYNKEWGYMEGNLKNSSENFYHKPHLSINHYLNLSNEGLLATSMYFSPGIGGGKWSDSFGYERNLFSFRDENGQIAWDDLILYNQSNMDTFELTSGEKITGYSKIVQTNYLASHIWTGVISSLEIKPGPRSKISSGIHYRYFRSDLRQEVADLLGGQFYLDDYGWSLAGVAGRNQVKKTGDVIRVHNGALIHQSTLFCQFENHWQLLDFFTAMSISDNRFRRHDVYNYPDNKWSDWVVKPGFDIKTGIGYRHSDQQHLFFNAGFFSKAPYYKFIFGNYNNVPSLNIRNEKVVTIEAGYSFNTQKFKAGISAYKTKWIDVSFLSNEYIQLENNSQTRAMVNGLESIHQGVETTLEYSPIQEFNVVMMASIGDWKWNNDVSAKLLNDLDVVVDTVNVYAKGLFVGGQPQIQLGLAASAQLVRRINLEVEWFYYDRQYTQFDPAGRQNPNDNAQSYRIPASNVTNIAVNVPIKISDHQLILFGKLNNVFNQRYITGGDDGATHTLETFQGFWSFGRTLDFGLRIELSAKKSGIR